MNVYIDGTFIGSFDNSNWTQENGGTPWVDIGREHVNEYIYQQEYVNGTTPLCSKRSDEGTLA